MRNGGGKDLCCFSRHPTSALILVKVLESAFDRRPSFVKLSLAATRLRMPREGRTCVGESDTGRKHEGKAKFQLGCFRQMNVRRLMFLKTDFGKAEQLRLCRMFQAAGKATTQPLLSPQAPTSYLWIPFGTHDRVLHNHVSDESRRLSSQLKQGIGVRC